VEGLPDWCRRGGRKGAKKDIGERVGREFVLGGETTFPSGIRERGVRVSKSPTTRGEVKTVFWGTILLFCGGDVSLIGEGMGSRKGKKKKGEEITLSKEKRIQFLRGESGGRHF